METFKHKMTIVSIVIAVNTQPLEKHLENVISHCIHK